MKVSLWDVCELHSAIENTSINSKINCNDRILVAKFSHIDRNVGICAPFTEQQSSPVTNIKSTAARKTPKAVKINNKCKNLESPSVAFYSRDKANSNQTDDNIDLTSNLHMRTKPIPLKYERSKNLAQDFPCMNSDKCALY